MELKDLFDEMMCTGYKENNVVYTGSDNNYITEKKDSANFVIANGEKAVKILSKKGFSLDQILFQNKVLKGEIDPFNGIKEEEQLISEDAISIIKKGQDNQYSQKDYNRLCMAYFTIGVDAVLKEEFQKYYNT